MISHLFYGMVDRPNNCVGVGRSWSMQPFKMTVTEKKVQCGGMRFACLLYPHTGIVIVVDTNFWTHSVIFKRPSRE